MFGHKLVGGVFISIYQSCEKFNYIYRELEVIVITNKLPPVIEVMCSNIKIAILVYSQDKIFCNVDGVKLGFFCKKYWQGCGARLQVIAPIGSKECHVEKMDTLHTHTHLSATKKRPAYGINSILMGQIIELVQRGTITSNAIVEALTTSGFEPPPEQIIVNFLFIVRNKLWEKEKTRRVEENPMTNIDIPRRKKGAAWTEDEKQWATRLVPADFDHTHNSIKHA